MPIIDGKTTFVFRATANLQSVSFAMGKTDEPAARTYDLIYLIREGRESVHRVTVSMGDWTFDIDALGAYGKIAQRIIVFDNNGKPSVTYMQVVRKDTHGVICQAPKRRFARIC